ncbi:hypothetical protein [Crateriforma conspicua]|uniref:DUF4350 domain-containing protein n=1 Tax=Crateriforma conspicua TaxID=2527996 RepID=A0A5C6FJ03_9PLAN|nr:hypothetical protein [Crateriforma conspicua]TWU60925.1 hypothetical protein V7x_52340 [Crateriforma conspicua]
MRPRYRTGLIAICLLLIPGCNGCRDESSSANKDQSLPQTEYTDSEPVGFPSDRTRAGFAIKPGHWLAASQTIKSNLGDRRGRLQSEIRFPVLDRDGTVTGQRRTWPIQADRPVVLPKGQSRQFEFRFLAPAIAGTMGSQVEIFSRLQVRGQVQPETLRGGSFSVMAPQEYFFVVLTERPERFVRLKVADWVRPYARFSQAAPSNHYRVVLPLTDGMVEIPETMLDWSSVSVLFWDDLPSETLTPSQWQAIDDWIHFGGRLIVNGSDAAESLQRSVLGKDLPLRVIGNLELDADAAETMLNRFSVESDRSVEKQITLVRDGTARVMSEAQVREETRWVDGSGELIARRPMGRGVVVQSRFDLLSEWATNWDSFDSFVNSVVLDRPRRRLIQESGDAESELDQMYPDLPVDQDMALINTGLRLASRDAAIAPQNVEPDTAPETTERPIPVADQGGSFQSRGVEGVAGWNSMSGVVAQIRRVLQNESGVEIPSIGLVGRTLAIYFVCLVPVNFLIFRLMGRTEYAWFAIPILAIAGAVWVARVARLDIGFARSHTEIAVLETQPGHDRGHLTQVAAIYNSLSTDYEVAIETNDAAVAPFDLSSYRLRRGEVAPFSFSTSPSEGTTLSGFSVASNRTEFLHAERMIELDGPIELKAQGNAPSSVTVLYNGSRFDLRDCYVIRAGDDANESKVSIAKVDDCVAGSSHPLAFVSPSDIRMPDSIDSVATKIWATMIWSWPIEPGQVRLIGRLGQRVDGMEIRPAATQISGDTVLVSQLRYPIKQTFRNDENLPSDFRRVLTDVDPVEQDASTKFRHRHLATSGPSVSQQFVAPENTERRRALVTTRRMDTPTQIRISGPQSR